MEQPNMWKKYASLPIDFAQKPKSLEEIRVYRLHLQAKQLLATRTSAATDQDKVIQQRLGSLADLEDEMLARFGFGRMAA